MKNVITGAIGMLVLMGVGLFWYSGRAELEAAAPPPLLSSASEAQDPADLPSTDPGEMIGPEPPEASELSKEQQRFFRYDRDRDWRISRTEMLATRSDGFRKLDKDGNNLLTFEEWAVATVDKFEGADVDGDNELTPAEFATTKPKPARKRRCAC